MKKVSCKVVKMFVIFFLLGIPGGDSWPSGVLICGENWVSYKHQGHVEIRTPLPRRHDLPPERGVLITAGKIFGEMSCSNEEII